MQLQVLLEVRYLESGRGVEGPPFPVLLFVYPQKNEAQGSSCFGGTPSGICFSPPCLPHLSGPSPRASCLEAVSKHRGGELAAAGAAAERHVEPF